jgi:hypothetical protein
VCAFVCNACRVTYNKHKHNRFLDMFTAGTDHKVHILIEAVLLFDVFFNVTNSLEYSNA